MSRNVYEIELDAEEFALPLEKGGTGSTNIYNAADTLSLITEGMRDVTGGVASLDENGKLLTENIPETFFSFSVSVTGPKYMQINSYAQFRITNYDDFIEYVLTPLNGGSITRNRDLITYTAPGTTGLRGFIVNDRVVAINITSILVNQPSIEYPVNYTGDLRPPVITTSSVFGVPGITETHAASDWQLATDIDFTAIVLELVDSPDSKTSWALTSLTESTTYYVRVRYKGSVNGYGSWSEPLAFTMANSFLIPFVASPIIDALPNYGLNTWDEVNFSCSAFQAIYQEDTHISSDWQLSVDPGFNIIVQEALDTTGYLTNWAVSGLVVSMVYYVRVRHRGTSLGDSAWSVTKVFITRDDFSAPYVNQAEIVSPPNSSTEHSSVVHFTTNDFSVFNDNDGHSGSDWQISSDLEFTTILAEVTDNAIYRTSWFISGLIESTTYFVRARHKGVKYGYGAYSPTLVFTTETSFTEPYVSKASMISPVNLVTEQRDVVTFLSSDFTVTNGFDYHIGSDWQLATDGGFSDIVRQSNSSSIYKTTWVVEDLHISTTYYARVRHRSHNFGYGEWSDAIAFTTRANFEDPTINKPVILDPINGAPNQLESINISSNSFSVSNGTDIHEGSNWQLSTDNTFNTLVKQVANSFIYRTDWFVDQLEQNKIYYVRVRHKGATHGFSAWSDPIFFSTKVSYVDPTVTRPAIVNPPSGASAQLDTVSMTSSPFMVSGAFDSQTSSDWQLATDSLFNTVVREITNSANDKTSWTVTGLNASTTYYARVRHNSATYGASDWSNAISFATKLSFDVPTVAKPSITSPANGSIDRLSSVGFTSSTFFVSGGTDTHEGSDWQLSTNSSFLTVLSQVENSSLYKGIWSVTSLLENTTYYARVRHKGATSGYSEWSDVMSFTTKVSFTGTTTAGVAKAVITSPTNGATDQLASVSFSANAFSSTNLDTHEGSDWQVSTNSAFSTTVSEVINSATNKTSWTVSGLVENTTYYARTRHKGVTNGYGAWSDVILFSTAVSFSGSPTVAKAVITTPANNATNQATDLDFITGAFAVSNGSDTHAGSDWQISTNSSFTAIFSQVINSATDKTTWFVTGLTASTVYYVRVRHKGTTLGYGAWSNTIQLTTASSGGGTVTVNTPSITSPTNGATGQLTSVGFTASAFGVSSGSDTHESSDWEVASNSGFTTIVASSLNSTTNKTSFLASGLTGGTTYYARVRYKGTTNGLSSWSSVISFTTAITDNSIKIMAPDKAPGDEFGYSLAVTSNGERLAVGAWKTNGNGVSDSGAVYVFAHNGTAWVQEAKLVASDAEASDQFGRSVALNNVGARLAIGSPSSNAAPYSDFGAVYVFGRFGTSWVEEAKLIAANPFAGCLFGQSVSISADGTILAVGSPGYNLNDIKGMVFVFVNNSGIWVRRDGLYPSTVIDDGIVQFGKHVAISGDGTRLVASASGSFSYIFASAPSLGNFGQEGKLSVTGEYVVIDNTGTRAFVHSSGSIFVFVRNSITWTHEANIPFSGTRSAINSDGSKIIIIDSSMQTGSVYVRSGATWSNQSSVAAASTVSGDAFGSSAAMYQDGSKMFVGAPGVDQDGNLNYGAVYQFT